MLETAKNESRSYTNIQFESANILKPPFADQSFDFVLCNQALHHFSTEQAITIIQNLWKIARHGILVSDLERSKTFYHMTKYFIPLFSANSMTRYDAPLSVGRAFTQDEMLRLAFHAKVPDPEVRQYFFGRQVLSVLKKD